MNARHELINYIKSLTPEQVEKIMNHFDFLKQSVNGTDSEAIIQSFHLMLSHE